MKHTMQPTNTPHHKHHSHQVQLCQGCVGGKGLCNRSSALIANPVAPTPPQPPSVGTMKHTMQPTNTPQTSLTPGSALSRLCWWQGTVQSKQRPQRQISQSGCTYTTTTTTMCRHNETHNATYQHTTPQTSLTPGPALSRLCWWQGTVQSKQRPHRESRWPYTTTTTKCRHNETHNAI